MERRTALGLALATAGATLGAGAGARPGAAAPGTPAPAPGTPAPAGGGPEGTGLPPAPRIGRMEVVHRFFGAMPTGVTVSAGGRIFVNFPRWGDPTPYTVAELRGGREVPYPDAAVNRPDPARPARRFLSVQSVVVDPADRLWVLDTGRPEFGPPVPGGPKLVGVDLRTDRVFRTITFPPDVALPTTYLNDIRFDLRRGADGLAFITDSSDTGPNGIIVVDLGSGRSWRRLHDHPSVRAEPGFVPVIEGRPVLVRPPGGPDTPLTVGADGIAISPDGEWLYYCPLAGRNLFRVPVDALADRRRPDAAVARAVRHLGVKGMSDGLETDDRGRVYGGDLERTSIIRRRADGRFETVLQDPALLWPDTLSIAADRHLYAIVNQLHRSPRHQGGRDLRRRPYLLIRTPLDAGPAGG